LFADVLHAHLLEELPDVAPELHRRASTWFERHGETAQAVLHSMAAHDFARAADLMELAIPALSRERREAEFYGWAQSLPDEVVAVRPVLGIALAGALAQVSEFATVARRLDAVELSVRGTLSDPWPEQPPVGLVVVDVHGYQRLPGMIQMYRAAVALTSGDLKDTFSHAQQALDLAPTDDDLTRAAAGVLAGLAAWAGGDLEGALTAYRASMAGLQRAGFVADVLGCRIAVADILLTQGRLSAAQATYQTGLELAASQPGPPLRGTADMHVGLAAVLLERDDRVGAAEHLAASQQLGEHNGLPQNPYRWRLVMARLRQAEGDLDTAVALVDEAARVYAGDYTPSLRPVPAVRARLQLRRGELGLAAEWAAAVEVCPEDDLTYLREFEHVTLGRLLLAEHAAGRGDSTLHEAIGLLNRLLAAADAGARDGTVIEILLLLALAHQQRRDTTAAMHDLQRAVALAAADGFVRMFADEGEALVPLLTTLALKNTSGFVRRLIATIGTRAPAANPSPLVVPLSDRELDVLRLLGSDLNGPDIARELSVSLNTMRTHTKSIYAKLGVNSRRAAVMQAAELNLPAGTRHR
jgi:LuxR family maltose regulon positive regulatory protein